MKDYITHEIEEAKRDLDRALENTDAALFNIQRAYIVLHGLLEVLDSEMIFDS